MKIKSKKETRCAAAAKRVVKLMEVKKNAEIKKVLKLFTAFLL